MKRNKSSSCISFDIAVKCIKQSKQFKSLKTRSGKIMRRVLKARAQGLPEGDISTLEE